jgi:outer membrane receptor protein involved in Fe transport
VAGSGTAQAQDIEVPILVIDQDTDSGEEGTDDDLDLANLVTSAAKGLTTVQEAPAIITIIPGEEIQDRQAMHFEDLLDGVPGFMRHNSFNGMFPQPMARGMVQGVLSLQDGVSTFDSWFNAQTIHRGVPLEMVKRVEIISGPGGVLWGANSYVGVINIISKDAEDIDGVEVGVRYGDGRGDEDAMRIYAQAGLPELMGKPDWGLVLHASYERYKGAVYDRPAHMFSTPLPNPNSKHIYGPSLPSDQPMSSIVDLTGKLTMGNLTLQVVYPFMDRYMAYSFNGPASYEDLPEDDLEECQMLQDPNGSPNCWDINEASRRSEVTFFERRAQAEYKTRFSDKAGLNVKVYGLQFVRQMDPILVLLPTPELDLKGGLAFYFDADAYRAGTSVDGDYEITDKFRVLYGAEGFHEWLPDTVTTSRQGAGIQATFLSPYDLAKLPLLCPRTGGIYSPDTGVTGDTFVEGCPVTFRFDVSRTTVGGFGSFQYRPSDRLILDAGARLQMAPELSSTSRGYGLQPTLGAAAVYEFIPDWHVKLNYAEGFRPPTFNATDANGEAVQIDGARDLEVERSRSGQVEVNFIAYIAGVNTNVGDRGIHSGEFLAKLYLKGGHRLELAYTTNRIEMADRGQFHAVSNNWFSLTSINKLAPTLHMASEVRVYGAFEDPNRRVDTTGLQRDPLTGAATTVMGRQGSVTTNAYDVVFDRQPAAAEVRLGLAWIPDFADQKLRLQGVVHNAFDVERGSYDISNDLEPRLEIINTEYEAFRFYLSGTYSF